MLNKIYKTIHNRYSKFFRFIFFLRYLFTIFLISIALFLIIPNYFNYEKRAETIKNHLFENYNFEIDRYKEIKFQALPLPKLVIKGALINFGTSNIKFKTKYLSIYPRIFSIYNYKNFQTKKIVLNKNNINLRISKLKFFTTYFFNQKNNLYIDDLDLQINDEDKSIIEFKNISFSNFGYKKNIVQGEVFGKKFITKIDNNFESINFELLNSGINANINLDEKNKDIVSGVLKSKIINNKLKFNFKYNFKVLEIYNLYLRSKNISFNNNSTIILNPFLDVKSKFDIQEINFQIFQNIKLNKLLEKKNIIKKINSENEIIFVPKKFSRNLIDNLNLKIDLAYGRINYIKKFSISENFFKCKGNINLLEEFPLLFFDCLAELNNKQKLLKKFSIKTKDKKEKLQINVSGNLSILNKKINLKNISMNDNYSSSREDLKYFKNTFENILFDENFIEIFNLKKIKEFITEIS